MELDIIHNADCVEGLKQIPNNSVNLVLTDIPYGEINRHAGNRGGRLIIARDTEILTKALPML